MRCWGIASLLVAGVAAWLLLRTPGARVVPSVEVAPSLEVAPSGSDERMTRPAVARVAPRAAAVPPAAVKPAVDGEHAHPITSEHEWLRGRTALIGQLNDALDLRDVASLRALIEAYTLEDPEDTQRLAEGYERVADCLEHPQDQASRANAQRYYDDARASSVRRYVRRLCLEDEATLSRQ